MQVIIDHSYSGAFGLGRQIVLCLLTIAAGGLLEEVRAQDARDHQIKLSQEALFHRCYSHLTRKRAASSHPFLRDVKSGSLTAIEACMKVLDKAQFVDSGKIANINDSDAQSILSNFYDFHFSWFRVKNYDSRPITYTTGELRHNNPGEGALAVTRLLFEPGRRYDESVLESQGVRGLRTEGSWISIKPPGSAVLHTQLAAPLAGHQRGTMIGVSIFPPELNSVFFKDSGEAAPESALLQNQTLAITNTRRAFGGGIMGLQSYIWGNSGFPMSGERAGATEALATISNASIRMHRRWSQNIFSDLMCRDLPVLRAADVNTMVEEYHLRYPSASGRLPFRDSATCMSCHATIDPMAATIRNLVFVTGVQTDWGFSPGFDDTDKTSWVKMVSPSQPSEVDPYHLIHRDNNFYKRPPKGHLRYRSYDGSLVNDEIVASDTPEALLKLGRAIASKNDLYVCAAARYFNFFTGIKVALYDEGDPRNPPLSAADRHYRNKVVNLGLSLKNHQSLRKLIEDIFNLDIYQKSGMRDLEQ